MARNIIFLQLINYHINKHFKLKEMKKLKLNFQHLGNAEILTRSQLKQIMGGYGSGGGGNNPDGSCTYTAGEKITCTSETGDCKNLYCVGQTNGVKPASGICCDGVQYVIPGMSDGCSYHGGTLNCEA